jgi:hypothetical protein
MRAIDLMTNNVIPQVSLPLKALSTDAADMLAKLCCYFWCWLWW